MPAIRTMAPEDSAVSTPAASKLVFERAPIGGGRVFPATTAEVRELADQCAAPLRVAFGECHG